MDTGNVLTIAGLAIPLILAAIVALVKLRSDSNSLAQRLVQLEQRSTAHEHEITHLTQQFNTILVMLARMEERLNQVIARPQ